MLYGFQGYVIRFPGICYTVSRDMLYGFQGYVIHYEPNPLISALSCRSERRDHLLRNTLGRVQQAEGHANLDKPRGLPMVIRMVRLRPGNQTLNKRRYLLLTPHPLNALMGRGRRERGRRLRRLMALGAEAAGIEGMLMPSLYSVPLYAKCLYFSIQWTFKAKS
jgi:hypothetical protein